MLQPNKSILVAEDDAATRRALVTLLGASGYEVRDAANGEEALASLRNTPPDLVLLDLTMPVLDGWQLLRERKQDPALSSVPVVVVTGTSGHDQQTLGVEAILAKPIDFGRLLDAVRELVTRLKPGVLVIDDEPNVRQILEIALSRHGFTVWTAAGGREGVEQYREHRDAIDLVLLDVQMPEQDGPQTLAALRHLDPQVRCCFMSGDLGRYDPRELLASGADRIFAKPFGLVELSRSLRCILKQ